MTMTATGRYTTSNGRNTRSVSVTDLHVGRRLRLSRMVAGMSQGDLAAGVNVTFQQIQKYEKGINRVSASRLAQFAKILHTSMDYFFEDAVVGEGIPARDKDTSPEALIVAFLSSPSGLKLNRAFVQLTNHKLRAKVVELVEELVAAEAEAEAEEAGS